MARKTTTKRSNFFAENCIFCINAPLLRLTSVSGLSCFRFKCEHTFTKNRCVIAPSKWLAFTSIILGSVTVTDISYQIYEYIASASSRNFIDILRLILDACLSLSFFLALMCLRDTEHRMQSYRGLISLLLARKSFGIGTIFGAQRVRKLRGTSAIYAFVIVFVTLTYGLFISKRLAKSLSVFVFWSMALSFSMDAVIYEAFFKKIHSEIKRAVRSRAIRAIDGRLGAFNLAGRLRRLQRYHIALYLNLKMLNRFLDVSGIFAILIAVNVMVSYCYMLINSFMGVVMYVDEKELAENLFIQCTCTGVLVYALRRISSLASCGDDVSSFLFRYPISKLSPAEAAQVEYLISSLQIHKPVLNASDIVLVGTGLLASISGTVITYVLVAVQFNASWYENTHSSVEKN